MDRLTNAIRCETLLQEGVSSAIATLHAIDAGGLLDSLPTKPDDAYAAQQANWLLDMLKDRLQSIQKQVEEMSVSMTREVR